MDESRSLLKRARERLRAAVRPVALTGAGASAESGIPTFRGPGGLWRSFRPEELAAPEAFRRDPKLVWEWYDWRRALVAKAEPNAGHRALAALEGSVPGFTLITQNVDGLHARAGSRRVLEFHGTLWTVRCASCGRVRPETRVPLPELPPRCACGGLERPGVVWFGESLDPRVAAESFAAAESADVFLVIGTSGAVEPAASLARAARAAGAYLIDLNPEPSALTPLADAFLQGPSAELLPRLING